MNNAFLSARYMVLSALGFSLMGACVKVAGHRGIPVLEIIAARALVSLLLSLAILKLKRIPIGGNNKPLLLLRGLVGTLALIFVYAAIVHIPYAEATSIQFLNPLFTAILAAVLLNEALQKHTLVAIFISIAGLLLVTQPGFLFDGQQFTGSKMGYVYALAGAFGSGIAYVLVRKLSSTEDPNTIILYFPLVALPMSLLLLGNNFVMPSTETAFVLLLVGIFTQLGQWGVTKGIEAAPAGKAMSFSYLQVVFALVLGVLFFDEVPGVYAMLGIVLIVSGTLLNLSKR